MPVPPCRRSRRGARNAALVLGFLLLSPCLARAATPRVHALVGARLVLAPGVVVERGTVVMRDGVIVAAGAKVAVPADARVWQADSLTIYPGLIESYLPTAESAPATPPTAGPRRRQPPEPVSPRGATHAIPSVRPETRAVETLPLAVDARESLRAAGFTVAQLAPREGILRGQTAVIGLGDGLTNQTVIRPDAAQAIAFQANRNGYPGSLMGAIAVTRQALMDAKWYRDVQAAYAKSPQGKERPAENVAWEALQPLVSGRQSAWFVLEDMLEGLRAAAVAREAGIQAVLVGDGDEYKRIGELVSTGLAVVAPVNFPEPPEIGEPAQALEVTTEELRHWMWAPDNPATLTRHHVPMALSTRGLKDVKAFRPGVARAIERGLSVGDALAAVTTVPARLLGLSDRLGTIAPGKIANLTVTRGDLFSKDGKVVEVWVDGDRYDVLPEPSLGGTWSLSWGKRPHLLIVSTDKDTTVSLVVERDTLRARDLRLEADRARFTVQRGTEPAESFDLWLRGEVLRGTLRAAARAEADAHLVVGVRAPEEKKDEAKKDKEKEKEPPVPSPVVMGNTEAWRARKPAQPPAVLVKNATVWTAGPRGTLEGADLLVKNGKIAAVGRGLAAPAGAVVLDAAGKHVAPGIIDEHSHAAILGDVNECTNSITCEVRIGDVVNSESPNIYRQLAGGTTIMHLLHGSCNSIGGQCAVIKNKWGEAPDRLLFGPAPPTVKFALGENPKQSNWGADATGRYPQSRAGVEQVIREAFQRAQDYRAAFAEWKQGKRKLPPRRDLQLEALQEIVEGKRLIHCHSYRQDEILMLMRLAEQFGFRVNTFTHIQEAYKVADELAVHGASAIGFSDWWAYKYEVIDGIPWNGYLLWDRGVNVGFNSDDAELARRLNTEAAKAVKYGGVPPAEAIKFVTLNPARSLKIDDRVGSIEVGKDADFSIWDGSPLSPTAHCEQTWIEGRKYFDRAQDLAGREALAKERAALLARAKGAKKDASGAVAANWPPRYLEDTNVSGSDCRGSEGAYVSDGERSTLDEETGR